MANRTFQDVQAVEREIKILATTLSAVNTTTPVATPSLGIEKVEEDSSGNYTITLKDKYNSLLCAQVTLGCSDGTQGLTAAFVKSEDVAGAKTIVIDTTGSADVNDSMHVTLFLKNTSVAR